MFIEQGQRLGPYLSLHFHNQGCSLLLARPLKIALRVLGHPLARLEKCYEGPCCPIQQEERWQVARRCSKNLCFLLVSGFVLLPGMTLRFMRESLAWASTQSQWCLLIVLPSVRFFWTHSVLQLAWSYRGIPKLIANCRKRDTALFLCRRWWQGPHWVLSNVSASKDFPWPWLAPTTLSEGVACESSLMLRVLGLCWGLAVEPFSCPHCHLLSSLEEFCQQNEAYCLSRQCFCQ